MSFRLFDSFGSRIVAGDTGIVLQNRGSSFSLDRSHPNHLETGKRPFHTIIPAMVFKENKLFMSFGVMGVGLNDPANSATEDDGNGHMDRRVERRRREDNNREGVAYARYVRTYIKRQERWQLLSEHLETIPGERTAVKIDTKVYDACASSSATLTNRQTSHLLSVPIYFRTAMV